MNNVYIELSESLDRIEVRFRHYDADYVNKIKTIKGKRWNPDQRIWTVPMEMKTAKLLRELFGDRLQLGEALRLWAKDAQRTERRLRRLTNSDDAALQKVPKVIADVIAGRPIEHPSIPAGHALRRKRPPRPYQRADIKAMSITSIINANDVGTGKTLEVIGALYEGQIAPKPVLIVAPRRTLVNVWQTEFDRLSDYALSTSESPGIRHSIMEEFVTLAADEQKVAIALIADDIRVDLYKDVKKNPEIIKEDPLHACRDYQGNWYKFKSDAHKAFFQIEFGAFVIDELHTTGLPNRKSLFHLGAQLIKAEFKWPMSGTPIGGKPRRLWPILNFIDPRQYASEWRWIEDWLVVQKNEVRVRGGATRMTYDVGGIRPGMEDEFYEHHSVHLIRRNKKAALPGLPDAVEIIVPTPMTPRQKGQYVEFDEAHEIMIGAKRLSGSIVLAQYTRMRQMANTMLDWDRSYTKPVATKNGGKYEHLIERLDENGIRKGTKEHPYEPGARAYIGVLDTSFMEVVAEYLKREGIDVATLHGGTKDSKPILDKFAGPQERPFVIVMTIQTGGTGLNLERANSAHALDEAWDPDVMHQFFGRGDRGSRDNALKCYIYRTPDSIQEYVAKVAGDKKLTNQTILDYVKKIEELRRK